MPGVWQMMKRQGFQGGESSRYFVTNIIVVEWIITGSVDIGTARVIDDVEEFTFEDTMINVTLLLEDYASLRCLMWQL